jgi:WXXGXW repeat (2 copies)
MTMKTKWIASVILASALAVPAFAQVGVYVGAAPPALRYDAPSPIPGPGYVWTNGYWNVNGGRYVWRRGEWRKPPYEGAYWSHPHYDHYPQGWAAHEGHWDHEDYGSHHDWNHHDHDGDRH